MDTSIKKSSLVLLTIVLVIVGIVLSSLLVMEYIGKKGCEGQSCPCVRCVCEDGEYSCVHEKDEIDIKEKKEIEINQAIEQNRFVTNNLKYSSEFISFPIANSVTTSPILTTLKRIYYVNGNLEVSFLQKQICNAIDGDLSIGEAAGQAGFYYLEDDNLVLYNVVNPFNQYEGRSCTVKITYKIDSIDIDNLEDFSLYYQSEEGRLEKFSICVYNGKILMEEDVYEAKDGCNTCVCKNSENICSTDKACGQQSSGTASVYRDYPNYEVYEYPERDNECSKNSQCYTGGCQSEICSPVNGKMSNCSVAVDMKSNIECKCVQSKCVWVD